MMNFSAMLGAGLLACAASGCSVYHDARRALPPSQQERVDLRIKDARSAEVASTRAAHTLLESPGPTGDDVDRLDLASREFQRSVLSIGDVMGSNPEGPSMTEVSRLRRRSDSLATVVTVLRTSTDAGSSELRQWLASSDGSSDSNK